MIKILKIRVFHVLLVAISCCFLISCSANRKFFSDDFQEQLINKRVIQNKDGRVELRITEANPKAKKSNEYFWFRSGEIHSSTGNYSGLLLNKGYTKFYLNNDLREKGTFKNGLKTGAWQLWHFNGMLKAIVTYKNGFQQGRYIEHDTLGDVIIDGHYKKNLKHGKWINHIYTDPRQADSISSNLKETGHYKKGYKSGTWKTYYINGKLHDAITYKYGIKHGKYIEKDILGNTIEKGHYKKDLKNGKWIHTKTKDTLYFKSGVLINEADSLSDKNTKKFWLFKKKTPQEKEGKTDGEKNFFQKLFAKKEGKDEHIKEKDTAKKKDKKKKEKKPTDTKKQKPKKEGFLGFFKKKEKSNK